MNELKIGPSGDLRACPWAATVTFGSPGSSRDRVKALVLAGTRAPADNDQEKKGS